MKKKTVALLLACVLALGVAVGGSLAWLTAESAEVKNTFTDSDVNITLAETTTEYKMIPGWTIAKDPLVTVDKDSEDCFVFVKIETSPNYESYLEPYTIDPAWEQLTDASGTEIEGVFYQKVSNLTADWTDYVLKAGHDSDCSDQGSCDCANKNGFVTVRTAVTKEMMDAIDGVVAEGAAENTAAAELANRPTLTFTAYASQLMKNNAEEFEPYEAWANVSNPTGSTPP